MTREDLDFIGSLSMHDEISNEAYKKIVCHFEGQETKTEYYPPCVDCHSKMDEIRKAYDELKEPKTEWIPVSEKLPEDIRPVMVTWKNNDPKSYYQYIVGKHFIGVAHYLKGKWFWYSSTTEDFLAEYGRYDGEEFDEAIEVVAWMPLPEPYKKMRG